MINFFQFIEKLRKQIFQPFLLDISTLIFQNYEQNCEIYEYFAYHLLNNSQIAYLKKIHRLSSFTP